MISLIIQDIGPLYGCLGCTCFIISAALGGCGILGLLMYYASDACDTYMLSCEHYIPIRKQVLSIPANFNAPTNSWYALLQLDTCLVAVPDQPLFRNQYDAIDYVAKEYPVDSYVSIGIPKSEPYPDKCRLLSERQVGGNISTRSAAIFLACMILLGLSFAPFMIVSVIIIIAEMVLNYEQQQQQQANVAV